MTAKRVAEGEQRPPHLLGVVQLAVVDENRVPVGGEHGLGAAFGVDDRQTAVDEGGVSVQIGAVRVRSARPQTPLHRPEHRAAAACVAHKIDKASNSAHEQFLLKNFSSAGT